MNNNFLANLPINREFFENLTFNNDFLANLTLTNLVRTLWQRKSAIAVSSLLFFLILSVLLFLIPRKFESEGKLFVRLGRGGVTLDPTATTGETILVQDSRESEINSILDFLRSRGVLDKVVNTKFNPKDKDSLLIGEKLAASDSLLAGLFSSKKRPSSKASKPNGHNYETLKANDVAIETLYNCLTVKAPRNAPTISISCRTKSPAVSRRVVECLMDIYIVEHVEARKTDGSFAFFEEQFGEQKKIVSDSSKALSQFKSEIGVMDVGVRRTSLRTKITDIERQLISAKKDLAAAQSQYNETQKMLNNPTRKVVLDINSLKQQFLTATIDIAGAKSENELLTQQLAIATREMNDLNGNEVRLAELERNKLRAETNFRIYSEKREEARINLELDQKSISNVKIIQPATLQVKHVSPRYKLILPACLICSIFAAACLAVFFEQLNSRFMTTEEIEKHLDLEVLATVPRFTPRQLTL